MFMLLRSCQLDCIFMQFMFKYVSLHISIMPSTILFGFSNCKCNNTCISFSVSDAIKDYFGVHIGMYFAFLGHYTMALTIPALLGVLIWLYSGSSQVIFLQQGKASTTSGLDLCPPASPEFYRAMK